MLFLSGDSDSLSVTMLIKASRRAQKNQAQMVTTITPPTQQSGQGPAPSQQQEQQEQRQEPLPNSEQQERIQQELQPAQPAQPHEQQIQQQQQPKQQPQPGMPQQNPALGLTQQRAVSKTSSASVDSGQKDQSATLDQQEIIWNKLQDLKEKYLLDMYDLHAMIVNHISDNQQSLPPDQLQKLNHYNDVLSRMFEYLTAPRKLLPKEFGLDKMESFEKQVVSIVETFKKRTPKRKLSPQRHQRQQQQRKTTSGAGGTK